MGEGKGKDVRGEREENVRWEGEEHVEQGSKRVRGEEQL